MCEIPGDPEIAVFIHRMGIQRRHAPGEIEHHPPLEQQDCEGGQIKIFPTEALLSADQSGKDQKRSDGHPERIAKRKIADEASVLLFGPHHPGSPDGRLRVQAVLFHPKPVCQSIPVNVDDFLSDLLHLHSGIRHKCGRSGHNLRRAEQRGSRLQKNLFPRRKKNSGKQQEKKYKSHHAPISRNESFFLYNKFLFRAFQVDFREKAYNLHPSQSGSDHGTF